MRRRASWPGILGGLLGLGLLVVGGLVPLARGAATVSFEDLEESLTCQCGCGLTVHSCNHLQCGSAIPLREEIRAQMKLGKSKEQILAYFSNKYGEKILSSPTARGFNLVAWVTPFVLVGLGGVFVGITLIRWSARGRPAPEPTPPEAPAPSPYDKVLEKELKDFEA
jgi:cytochrome c-type biogenesis protein CcmH